MTIKPKKVTVQKMLIGSIIVFILDLCIFFKSYIGGMILLGISFLYLIPECIASCRTFIFNDQGCTVSFLWYKKMYTWDELKMKQYVTYNNCYESYSLVTEAAEFSPKKVRIPKWMQAYTFSIFHPLSFVFVYFPPDPRPKDETRYTIEYEADKEEFRAKLKEWGVEMEEVVRGK